MKLTPKTPVAELGLPGPVRLALTRAGIENLGQLLRVPRKDLLAVRNLGLTRIWQIDQRLDYLGARKLLTTDEFMPVGLLGESWLKKMREALEHLVKDMPTLTPEQRDEMDDFMLVAWQVMREASRGSE